MLLLSYTQSTQAKIVILPSAHPSELVCFNEDVAMALDAIRQSDPVLAQLVGALESSDIRHTIKQSDGVMVSHSASDRHADIDYNPRYNTKFSDGVCVDSVAGLLHELYHAWENQSGVLEKNRLIKDESTNFIPLSELNAVNTENLYRRVRGLCPRVSYSGKALPPRDIYGECSNPESAPCPPAASACHRCCCWIYNLDGKGNACIIDNIPPDECYSYNSPGAVSAGCYNTPCNFPGVKTCP